MKDKIAIGSSILELPELKGSHIDSYKSFMDTLGIKDIRDDISP
jgi:DNA-directed RNA polymerase beta subunit